jgi:hypothetical protein
MLLANLDGFQVAVRNPPPNRCAVDANGARELSDGVGNAAVVGLGKGFGLGHLRLSVNSESRASMQKK